MEFLRQGHPREDQDLDEYVPAGSLGSVSSRLPLDSSMLLVLQGFSR